MSFAHVYIHAALFNDRENWLAGMFSFPFCGEHCLQLESLPSLDHASLQSLPLCGLAFRGHGVQLPPSSEHIPSPAFLGASSDCRCWVCSLWGQGGGGRYELALPRGPLKLLSSKPISVFGSNGSTQCVLGLEGQGVEGDGPGLQTHRDPPTSLSPSMNLFFILRQSQGDKNINLTGRQ